MASDSLETYDYYVPPEETSYILVAAIDFGTTFSGYAFSFKSSQKDIIMYKDWGNCVGIPVAFKAPTCVLTDKHDRFVAFGYEAQKKYTELTPEEADNYYFYENFKMELHKGANRMINISSTTGRQCSALDIFAMVLKYLADHVFKTIFKQSGSNPEREQVQWVVSVPAIWSEGSKQFMREAAFMAGLISKLSSKQLIIVLEPGAASLYCHQMDQQFSQIKTGTKFLVLDCGGGTLDVTAHKLLPDGKVSELYQANGGSLGGTQVDKKFVQLLKDIFGDDVINLVMTEAPSEWMELMINFERKKRGFDPQDKFSTTNISIPYGFIESYQSVKHKSIKNSIPESFKQMGVTFSSGMLRLAYSVMENLFHDVVDGIMTHVKSLLQKPELKNISHILLVGGFGECVYLQDSLRESLCEGVTLLVPDGASQCVLKGAVLFGHNPQVIVERISRKTYGIRVRDPYDPDTHDPSRMVIVDGEQKVDLFCTFIRREQRVKTSKRIGEIFTPSKASDKKVYIGILQSNNLFPTYTDEPGVEKLGDITIDLPGYGIDRNIEVSMAFGGTEIEVEARDPRPGGQVCAVTVDFLSSHSNG